MDKRKRFVNLRPLFVVALCFVTGILTYFCALFISKILAYSIIGLGVFALILLYFVYRKNYSEKLFIIFTLICILFLAFGYIYSFEKTVALNKSVDFKENYISGSVVSVSVGDKGESLYTAVVVKSGDKRIKLYFDGQKEIFYGDKVSFKANLRAVHYRGNKSEFYNLISGITHNAYEIGNFVIVENHGVLSRFRIKLRKTLWGNYPTDVASVAYALITGEDSGVNHSLIQSYRSLGIAHVFAVSGLHIGIFFGLLAGLCKLLKLNDKIMFFISAFVLSTYVAFCGGSASSIRAEVICLTALLVKIIGVKNDGLSTMCLSAIVVLLINPFNLFSVGFILSYAVYATLVIITPPLERGLNKLFLPTFAKIMAAYLPTTIISCVLSSYFFGYTSIYTFFANLIIVPLMPLLYSLTLITALLVTAFPSLSAILLPSGGLIRGLNFVISKNFIETGVIKGLKVKYTLIPLFGFIPIYGEYFNIKPINNKIFIFSAATVTAIIFILENVL